MLCVLGTTAVRDSEEEAENTNSAVSLRSRQPMMIKPTEENRKHYKGPPENTTPSWGTHPVEIVSSSPSLTSLSSPNSPETISYTSLDEVPTDISSLSVEDVLQCLRLLNFHRYVDKFSAEQVDGEMLMSVDREMLIEDFGFKRFEALKLQKFAHRGWRPKMDSASLHAHHQPQQ